MNKYMYLVGALGQIDLFDHAESKDEAEKLAEELARPGELVGIWKLQRVGRKAGFAWTDPVAETSTQPPQGLYINNHKKWTTSDCTKLKQYLCEGKTTEEISVLLGRTPRAVELKSYDVRY